MYVYEYGFTDEKVSIGFLGVFIVQVVMYCILKGVKRCGKN